MTAKQMQFAEWYIGKWLFHHNGTAGFCIGAIVAKKGKGVWLQCRNENQTFCMYRRCAQ